MKTFKQHITEREMFVKNWIQKIEFGKFASVSDLHRYLSNKFLVEPVGTGNFSIAYSGQIAPQYVLKVTKPGMQQDAWSTYAKWIWKNKPDNSLFPRIRYLYEFRDGSLATFIEYLEFKEDWNIAYKLEELFWHLYYLEINDDSSAESKAKGRAIEAAKSLKIDFSKAEEFVHVLINIMDEARTSFEYDSAEVDLDLHPGNIGYRKNGEIVILDPIAVFK